MDDNKYEIEIVTTKTSIQHSVKSKLRAANVPFNFCRKSLQSVLN